MAIAICSPSTRSSEARDTLPASIRLAPRINNVDVMGDDVLQIQSETTTLPWTLHRSWLPPLTASDWSSTLMRRVEWQQPIVQVYGRHHPVPRLTMFLAEQDVSYRYSGTRHCGEGWPTWVPTAAGTGQHSLRLSIQWLSSQSLSPWRRPDGVACR